MKKLNSKGFGAIGVLIIVVVLAAIVGTGVYVWHQHSKTQTSNTSKPTASKTTTKPKSTSTQTTTTTTANPYSGWQTYTASVGSFTFKYPADWYVVGGGTGPSYGEVSLEPQTSQSSTTNAFRMTLWVNTNQDNSYAPYAIPNGTSSALANGINIWTTSSANSDESGAICPVMEIINAANTHFSYQLPDGQYLTMQGGYCEGQRDITNYNYQEQLDSQSWQTALKLLGSISTQ